MRYRIEVTTPDRLPNLPISEYTVKTEQDALNALIRESHELAPNNHFDTKVQWLDTDQGRIYSMSIADDDQTYYYLTANIVN